MIAVWLVLGVAVGVAAVVAWQTWQRRRAVPTRQAVGRIAFPFTAETLAEPALAAALRLARSERATLVPVYLAMVPRELPLDCAMPAEAGVALPLLETIEHRAARSEVAVDSRIERGRTVRHALAQLMDHERFDRMVVAAATDAGGDGFPAEDVAWLLNRAPAEIIALRPAPDGPSELSRTR